MIARELITTSITPLRTSDTGAFALAQMEEFRVSHLPIVNEVDFLGIISDTDILALNDPDEPVGNSRLSLTGAYVTEGQHIFEAMKVFDSLKLSLLPVLSDKDHFLGVITIPNLLKEITTIMGINNPGGIIVLEINDKDYTLTEIAHIVESNDAKILNLYVSSYPDSTKLDVTLKINRIDLSPVLQTFFRYNYTVKASWSHEDAYNEGLHDRFDALMNYLNI
jgi:acetoin utilization protein AcuB